MWLVYGGHMKPEKIAAVAMKYHELLRPDYQPIRFSEDAFALVREYQPENKVQYLEHACFMTLKIVEFVHLSKIEKANRWLGYLQCLLNITGTTSGYDGAMDNAPESVTYNRDG